MAIIRPILESAVLSAILYESYDELLLKCSLISMNTLGNRSNPHYVLELRDEI
ncbi:MAG: hypothetical protein ACI9Y7_002351 [Dokdonia sp.]|jgi:hypothetical protein